VSEGFFPRRAIGFFQRVAKRIFPVGNNDEIILPTPKVETKRKRFSTKKLIAKYKNFENQREERPSVPSFDALGWINCLSISCRSTVPRTLLTNNYGRRKGWAGGPRTPGF